MSEEVIGAPARRPLINIPPALRYPAYRSYWLGTLASVSGFQMFQFGQYWLVYQLTGSPLFLGTIGLANAIPAIVLNLFGGVFADLFDKRRLIIVTQSITALLIFLLAVLTATGMVAIWHVIVLAFIAGAVNAFDQPARQALYPHLIDRKVMMSAVALNASIWQGTRIVAPAMAGAVIALMGTSASFFLAGAGFVAMAMVMSSLKVPKIERGGSGNAAKDMMDGLKFIRDNSVFSFLISMTFFNSFFGMSYIMMMPAIAVDILRVGSDGQGLLMGIGGVGALFTTLYLGSRTNFKNKGIMLIGGATMFGGAVIVFGLSILLIRNFYLAMTIMVFMGIFSSIYMISIMSSLQMLVPDRMRGRVMGFYGMTWSIMPLSGMQAGLVATYLGTPLVGEPYGVAIAVAIGGAAVAAFALGPALVNGNVRNLGAMLTRAAERRESPAASQPQAAATASVRN